MKKIINFLRKIGFLHISSGDNITGEFDDLSDIGNVKKIKIKGDNMIYSHQEFGRKFSKKTYKSLPKWF